MGLPRRDGPRRGITVPPGGYAAITKLAAAGARESAIARRLGFSPASWSRLKQKDGKAMDAYLRGRDALEQELVSRVKEPAFPDDEGLSVTERIALLKSRQFGALSLGNSLFGWNKPDAEPTTTLAVTIALPSPAASIEDYRTRVVAAMAAKESDE